MTFSATDSGVIKFGEHTFDLGLAFAGGVYGVNLKQHGARSVGQVTCNHTKMTHCKKVYQCLNPKVTQKQRHRAEARKTKTSSICSVLLQVYTMCSSCGGGTGIGGVLSKFYCSRYLSMISQNI